MQTMAIQATKSNTRVRSSAPDPPRPFASRLAYGARGASRPSGRASISATRAGAPRSPACYPARFAGPVLMPMTSASVASTMCGRLSSQLVRLKSGDPGPSLKTDRSRQPAAHRHADDGVEVVEDANDDEVAPADSECARQAMRAPAIPDNRWTKSSIGSIRTGRTACPQRR